MNVNTLVPAIAIAFLYSSVALSAQSADSRCHLNVSSAPLDEALSEVGRQCGIQILYYSNVTAGKTAPQVNGEYAIDDALRRLLGGAGLTFREVNATTLEIRRVDAADRPQRAARSSAGKELELQQVVIKGTAQGLVATRIETPLRDIPQTISIISREQMRQQNNQSLADVMADAVGITTRQRDSSTWYLYARGYNVTSYTVDGGGGLRSSGQTPTAPTLLLAPDLAEFDHIEVMRGSNALFGADTPPGAAINLVRKRPLHEPAAMFSATAGSWNNYRQEADITGPLALDGALRGRLVVSNARRNYFYETANDARRSVFGVLDYDLTGDTLLTVGGSYSKSRARPFEIGLPLFSDGTDSRLPRDTSFAFDWTRFDTRVAESFLRLEQAFGETTRLRINATYFDNSVTYLIGALSQLLSPITRRLPRPSAQFTLEPSTQRQLNLEATLTGTSQWWSRRVEWVLGSDYLQARSHTLTAQDVSNGLPVDPYHFDPAMYPPPISTVTPLPLSTAQDEATHLGGFFGSLRVELTQPWSVTAGLRLSNERILRDTIYYWSGKGNPAYTNFEYERVLTPYLGTLFTLDSTWSLYASYTDIFLNMAGRIRRDSSDVPPSHGVTMEGGIKGVWRNGALNGSLALYETTQQNISLRDANATPLNSFCCWTSNGRNVSKGADVELSGHLAPQWLIGGGYTFNQSRQVVAGQSSWVPAYKATPRHLLRLWTDYGLPGSAYRWRIGGSLNAQSTITGSGTQFAQSSYAVISPRVGYRLGEHWQVGLNINNLFDRRYYETFEGGNQNWYGEPRNYMVRVDTRF